MIERYMLNEELEENVIKITGVDYTGMLTITDIENIIKDLVNEYHCLEEKLEDQETHCRQWHETRKDIVRDECYESFRDYCLENGKEDLL